MPDMVIAGWTVLWTFNPIDRKVIFRLSRGDTVLKMRSRPLGATEGVREVVTEAVDAMIEEADGVLNGERDRLLTHARQEFESWGHRWESLQ